MLKIISSKLAGIPGNLGWTRVYEYSSLDNSLYLIISSDSYDRGMDINGLGEEIFTKLKSEYHLIKSQINPETLKEMVYKIFSEFAQNMDKFEIIFSIFASEKIYFITNGTGAVTILRNGSLVKILESSDKNLLSISGICKKDDKYIIGTGPFFNKFSMDALRAVLSLSSPDMGIDKISPFLKNQENSAKFGVIILKVIENETDQDIIVNLPKNEKTNYLLKSKLLLNNFLKKFPKKNIYIKPEFVEDVSPQSKKSTFLVAIILLVLLCVSIGFGIKQKKVNDTKSKYISILKQAEDEVDQAISLASISSERSRELFVSSQQKVIQIEELKIKDSGLEKLKQKINDSRAVILGEYLVTPDMFLDLSLLSSGFKGDTVSYSGGKIYVMDSVGKRVVSVDVSNKKSKVVAGPSVINSVSALACYEDKVFVLQSDGIYQVDSGNTKVINKTWQGEALIAAFAGNMYVVDKSGGQIYRYQGVNNTFSEKQNWLAAGTNVSFDNVSQITIDGLIYALYPNSKILKFSQGSPLNFNVKGVIPEIGNIDAINANPDNQFIYLLDRAGKRVVVVDKKGTYKAQYVGEVVANSANLVVSEKDKKIILLTGDKLYSIDIKN